MKKRLYLIIAVILLTLYTIDFKFPDHHHAHFPWHLWPGFDVLFGLIGTGFIAFVALTTGYLFLWRFSHSIALEKKDMPGKTSGGKLTRYFVKIGDTVKKGEHIAEVETPKGKTTISSPKEGIVTKIFMHPEELIDVGNTLIDLKILPEKSKKTKAQGIFSFKNQRVDSNEIQMVQNSPIAMVFEKISPDKKRKGTHIIIALALLSLFLIDHLFPDHSHAHFIWHQWSGFDILFGLSGCLLIATMSMGGGYLFLWRPTCSIYLKKNYLPKKIYKGVVRKNLVTVGDHIQKGQPVSEIKTDKEIIVIPSPVNGVVTKVFTHPDEVIEIGNSLVDVKVSKEILFHHNDLENKEANNVY